MENIPNKKFERFAILRKFEASFEVPMLVLALIWLFLLAAELLDFMKSWMFTLAYIIWGLFIIEFLIKLIIAPEKIKFLKKNILTIISLIIPAFRVLRIIAILRYANAIRFIRIISGIGRSFKSIGKFMGRRGLGYVLIISILVIFAGSAGIFAFEKGQETGITSFWDSLWFTSMLMITIGTGDWPGSAPGRILSFLIAIYGFAFFGYITASIAGYFLDLEHEKVESKESDHLKVIANELEEIKNLLKNVSPPDDKI